MKRAPLLVAALALACLTGCMTFQDRVEACYAANGGYYGATPEMRMACQLQATAQQSLQVQQQQALQQNLLGLYQIQQMQRPVLPPPPMPVVCTPIGTSTICY